MVQLKRQWAWMAMLFLAVTLSACSGDDVKKEWEHPINITATSFQQNIVGSAWEHVETYEVLEDGSVSSESYYKDLLGVSSDFIYYFQTDSTLYYYFSAAAIGFNKSYLHYRYQYDATEHLIKIEASRGLTPLYLEGDRLIVRTRLAIRNNKQVEGIILLQRVSAQRLKEIQKTYTYDYKNRTNP